MKQHTKSSHTTHWRPRALAALAVGGALVAIPTAAVAGEPSHGAYTWHHFADLDGKDRSAGFDSVTFEITVDTSPGDDANIFWSNQFGFVDGSGAYTGMQSNGSHDVNTFLFSLWDATEAKPGSEGSYCVEFGGEGEGMSCRMRHNWREGDRYQFTVAHEGDGWFGVEVDNLDDPDVAFALGSIRTPKGQDKLAATGMVSWTEYFEHGATCTNQPFAQATFKNPVTVPATANKAPGLTPSTECGASTVDLTAGGTIQRTGIGFPAKGGETKQPPARPDQGISDQDKPVTPVPPANNGDAQRPGGEQSTTQNDDCDVNAGSTRPGQEPNDAQPGVTTPSPAPETSADEVVVPLAPVAMNAGTAATGESLAQTGTAANAVSVTLAALLAAGIGGALFVVQRKRHTATMTERTRQQES